MSTGPTPRDSAPQAVRRQELVAQVMESLERVDELPTADRIAMLSQAQATLSAVLNNDSDLSQLSIPGVHETRP